MTDVTALGSGLVFSDKTKLIEGFNVTQVFGANTSASLHQKPNTGHIALSLILPTCNAAVAAVGASEAFDGMLLLSLLYQENRNLSSRSNTVADKPEKIARGLGQFIYDTGISINPSIQEFYNPGDAIYAAASYLLTCHASAKKKGKTLAPSLILGYAVMMYNAGPGYSSLATYDSPTLVNKVNGRTTKMTCKGYAKSINEFYKNFSGSSTGPLTFR